MWSKRRYIVRFVNESVVNTTLYVAVFAAVKLTLADCFLNVKQ